MNAKEIMDLVIIIVCVVTYAVMMYFKVKGNVLVAVSELIALAESTGLTGVEKMNSVVEQLMLKIPAPLKKVLSEKVVRKIAQYIFDWMREYADNYINAKKENGEEAAAELMKEELMNTSVELIAELIELSMDALKEKASGYGIELQDNATKEDIVKEILTAALNKA